MRRSIRLLLLAAVVFSVVWHGTGPAQAMENELFGITPMPERIDGVERRGFDIPLEVDTTFDDSVRVYNRTEQDIDLVLYAADAPSGPTGQEVDVKLRSDERKGVGGWIDLSQTELTLKGLDSATIDFKVHVESTNPSPEVGAIVVENASPDLSSDTTDRVHVLVITNPPNSPTTSNRVQPLMQRLGWLLLALAGLVVFVVLVAIGTRRARRSKDAVVIPEPVELEPILDEAELPASRPVIRRLGERARDKQDETTEHPRFSRATDVIDQPLLDDDMLVEIEPEPELIDEIVDHIDEDDDLDDDDLPLAGSAMRPAPARRPAAKAKPRPKPRVQAAKPKAQAKPKPKPKTKSAAKAKAKKPAPRKKVVKKAAPRKARVEPENFISFDDV